MVSAVTQSNLNRLYPMFYNDLRFIRNPQLEGYLVAGIVDAVGKAEAYFKQDFGGWYPDSNQFGIAPLRKRWLKAYGAASTLGNTRWTWTSGASTTVAWTTTDSFVASFNLYDDRFILVYGYFNLSPVPNTTEIQIKPGNVTLPVMNLQPMRMKTEPYLLFPQPILVSPRSPLQIDAACINISTAEEAGLLGYIIAPCSTLISK